MDASKTAAAKKRLIIFLAVTFGLSWAVQIAAGLALGSFQKGELATPTIVPIIALSMFFPLIGALIANWACGPHGKTDLGFRPRIKGNIRPYLAAWFVPALLALLGYVVFFAVNPQFFDPTLSGYVETLQTSLNAAEGVTAANMPSPEELAQMRPIIVASTTVFALTLAPFINAIPAFGEEAGWRGLLFPTLCELMSPRAAAVVSGVIWGVWHAPVIAMGHNYGMGYAGFPWTGILVMTLSCTAMGIWLALLRQRTQSVWPCALAHGAFNAIANMGIIFCTVGQTLAGPTPLGFIAGIPLFALGIFCLTKIASNNRGQNAQPVS